MNKKEEKEWDNVPYKTWEYAKQTEIKHKIFSDYLPLWLQILGKYNEKLNYIDGFGGIGAYHNSNDIKRGNYISDNFGSPIISIQAILNLKKENKIKNCNVCIIDESEKNLDNIKSILQFKKINISQFEFKSGDFDTIINNFLDSLGTKHVLLPTFFLLDPFGISGIKLNTLKRIMSQPRAEILLNFMYNSLQRWISHPDKKIQAIYDEYFGGDVWRNCKNKKTSEKESELVKIFRDKCKKFCKCKYVYPFKLSFPDKKKTYYYLFHLTNHWIGCARMKDSVVKNAGSLEYPGERQQNNLFDVLPAHKKIDNCPKCFSSEKLNYNDCAKCFEKILPQKIKYVEILKLIIDVVPLTEQRIKQVLQELELNKKIVVTPSPSRKGKRRKGFEDDDIVVFNGRV
jgi:three-Cys-motif partner protein